MKFLQKWFGASALGEHEKTWIQHNLRWFMQHPGILHHAQIPILTPNDVPVTQLTNEQQLERVLRYLANLFIIDYDKIEYRIFNAELWNQQNADFLMHENNGSMQSAARFTATQGYKKPYLIEINARQLCDVVSAFVTLAHEFCHIKLQGEGRATWHDPDMELFTDLCTCFYGFGLLQLLKSFEYERDNRKWTMRKLGYLSPEMLEYALAVLFSIKDAEEYQRVKSDLPPTSERKIAKYLSEFELRPFDTESEAIRKFVEADFDSSHTYKMYEFASILADSKRASDSTRYYLKSGKLTRQERREAARNPDGSIKTNYNQPNKKHKKKKRKR